MQACDPGFAMAWSWQSGLGDAHCRMAGANVMFVGRPRDGSEGREGGLGIRRGQFAGERELAEIRCHDGDGGGERAVCGAVCGEDGRSRGLIVWRAAVGGIRNSQEEGM